MDTFMLGREGRDHGDDTGGGGLAGIAAVTSLLCCEESWASGRGREGALWSRACREGRKGAGELPGRGVRGKILLSAPLRDCSLAVEVVEGTLRRGENAMPQHRLERRDAELLRGGACVSRVGGEAARRFMMRTQRRSMQKVGRARIGEERSLRENLGPERLGDEGAEDHPAVALARRNDDHPVPPNAVGHADPLRGPGIRCVLSTCNPPTSPPPHHARPRQKKHGMPSKLPDPSSRRLHERMRRRRHAAQRDHSACEPSHPHHNN